MSKHFYSHLIELDTLHVELDTHDLTDEEKDDLKQMMEDSVHHTVLDAILSELSEEDKRIFLQHLSGEDHTKIWEFVNDKVDNIEDKIKKAADDITHELHQDIRESKEQK